MQHWSPVYKKMIPAGPSGLICLSAEKERTNSPSSWSKSPGAGSSLNGNLTDRGKHCKKMLFEGSDDTTVTEVDEFKYVSSPNSKAVNELTSSVTYLNVTKAMQDENVGYFQPQGNGIGGGGGDEQSTVRNTSPNVLDSMIEATAVAMGCKPLPHSAANGTPQNCPSRNGSSPGVPVNGHQSTPASIPRAVLSSGDEILKWVEASYELARRREEGIPGVPDIRIPFSKVANKKESSHSIMMPVLNDGTELSEDEDEYSNPYIAMHTKLSNRLHIEALNDIKNPKPSTSRVLRGQITKMRKATEKKEKLIKKAVTNGNGATSSSPRIFHGTDEEIAEIEQMLSSPRKSARKRSIRDRDADDEPSLPNGDVKGRSSGTSNKQNMPPPKRKVLTPKVHSRRNVDPLRPVTVPVPAAGQPLNPKNKPARSEVILATPSPPSAKPNLTAQSFNTPTSETETEQAVPASEGRGFRVKKQKFSAQEKLKELKSHKPVGIKPLTNVTKHSSHQARAQNGKNFASNGGSETTANVSSPMPRPRQGEASIRPKLIKTKVEVTDPKPTSTDAPDNNASTDEETANAEAATVQQTIKTEPETTTSVVTLSPTKMPMLQLEHVKVGIVGKQSANTVDMPKLERQEAIKKAIATESKAISNGIKMEAKSTAQPTSNVAVILPKPEFQDGKRRKKDELARVHSLRQRSELTSGKNVTVEEVREVNGETSRKNVDGSTKLNVKNLKKDKDSGCILPVMTNGNHPKKQSGIDGKDNILHCSITENAVPKLEARRHTRQARPKANTEDSHHFRTGCGSSKSGGLAEIEVGREVAKENQIEAEMLSPPAEPRAVSDENADDIEVDKKALPERETNKKVNAEQPTQMSLHPVVILQQCQQIIQPQPREVREATEEGVSKSKKRKIHPEHTSGASPSNSEPDHEGSEARTPVLDSPFAQKDLIREENRGTSCHSSKPFLEAEESEAQSSLNPTPSNWQRNLKLCPLQLVIKLVRLDDQREWKDKVRSILNNNNNRDHREKGSEGRIPSTSIALPNGDNANGDGDFPPTSPPTPVTAVADGGSPEETSGTRRSIRAKKPSKLVDSEDWVR